MKRPMCVIGISFSIAMWAAFQLDIDVFWGMLLAPALLALGASLYRFWGKRARVWALAVIAVSLAFAVYSFYVERNIAPFERLQAQTVRFEGLITESTRPSERSARHTIRAVFPYDDFPASMIIAHEFGDPQLAAGDVISGELRLFEDISEHSRRFNRSRGVVLAGSLIPSETEFSDTDRFGTRRAIIMFQQRLLANVRGNLPANSAALIQGMVMGMTDYIPVETHIAMQRSGVAHLFAVSGLHLNIFAAFVLLLLSKFRLSPRVQSLITLACGFAFLAAVGFSASVMRALVMLAIIILARIVSMRADTLNSVGIALLVICIMRPYWVLGMGIWLSAGSCIGIALHTKPVSDRIKARFTAEAGTRRRRSIDLLADTIGISVSAYFLTLPLLFLMHGWISITAIIVNVLISPLVPIAMIGGILCAVLPPMWITSLIAVITHFFSGLIYAVARVFSTLPFSIVAFDRFWMLVLILIACILGIILYIKRAGRRIWAWSLAICIFLFVSFSLTDAWLAQDRIELITIGESEPVVIILRGNSAVLLSPPDRFTINRTMRYLNFRGVRQIDAVFAPNQGVQISSGLLRLNNSFEIASIIGPDDDYLLELLAQSLPGVPVYRNAHATVHMLGGVSASFEEDGTIYLNLAGRLGAFQYPFEYGTIERTDPSTVAIYTDIALWPDWVRPAFEPAGAHLFGETRVVLIL